MSQLDIVDLVVEEASRDEKLMAKVSESQEILSLVEQPGWAALKAHTSNGHESFKRVIWARLMSGVPAESLQREIDYARGAHDIVTALLRYPDTVVANLEVIIQRLYARRLQELGEESIADSPYIDASPEEVR